MIVEVNDGWFSKIPRTLVRAADIEWPDKDWSWWHTYENGKQTSKDPSRLPPACAELVRRVTCLQEFDVGYDLPDGVFPDLNLHGAGMHSIPAGCCLPAHFDAEVHPIYGWRRMANVIIYINERWDEEWGGEFRAECESMDGDPVTVVPPRFGRVVVFKPKDVKHEVLDVLCPSNVVRKTLTVFFWKRGNGGGGDRTRADFDV